MILDYGFASDVASRSFRLTANGAPVKVAETPPMSAAERAQLCAHYRTLPSYCHIYDEAGMHLHVAHVGAAGDVELTVETEHEIRAFNVLPHRRCGARRCTGRRLTFTSGIDAPRYFIVRIDALPPLMIVIDDPVLNACPADPSSVVDATSFLTAMWATSDRLPQGPESARIPRAAVDVPPKSSAHVTSSIDHTADLQRALAAVDGTGRTLVVPPGVYTISQLHLRGARDFRLHLAAGCLIKVRPSAPGANEHRHGLWLENCERVSITGLGCIDHQAYEHFAVAGNDYQHGLVDYYTANDLAPWITQSPLFITGSRHIAITGVTLRNGRNFNLNCRNCDDVQIRHVKILTPPACTPEYADGINTGSCQRVLIEDCLVAANDDAFASGHYFSSYDRRPASHHVVRRLLGWNLRGSGVRLGFYAAHDQGDFVFDQCDFVGQAHTSVLVHALQRRPDGSPARYGTIRFENCCFDAAHLHTLLSIEGATIERLEFCRVAFDDAPASLAVDLAGAPDHPIASLLFADVTVNGRLVRSPADLPGRIAHVARVEFR